jgi:peptide/nickel transport system substrate-binding protein
MRLVLLLLCLLATLLRSGLHAQTGDTLRIGIRDDPDLLDPTFSRTDVGTVVMTKLCDKLFDFDEHLAIVPVLAGTSQWSGSLV